MPARRPWPTSSPRNSPAARLSPELGPLGSARQGKEGDDQRRGYLKLESLARMGPRHCRCPRGPNRRTHQTGDRREEEIVSVSASQVRQYGPGPCQGIFVGLLAVGLFSLSYLHF